MDPRQGQQGAARADAVLREGRHQARGDADQQPGRTSSSASRRRTPATSRSAQASARSTASSASSRSRRATSTSSTLPYFTGGGQKARIRAQYGSRRQDYIIGFTEPWFLGRSSRLDTELYYRQLNYLSDNYEQTQAGGRVGLTKQLPFNLAAGVNYTLENIGIKFSDAYKAQYPKTVTTTTYSTNSLVIPPVITAATNTAAGPQPQLLQEEATGSSRASDGPSPTTRATARSSPPRPASRVRAEIVAGPLGGDVDILQARDPRRPVLDAGAPRVAVQHLAGHPRRPRARDHRPRRRRGRLRHGDRGNKGRVPLFDRNIWAASIPCAATNTARSARSTS